MKQFSNLRKDNVLGMKSFLAFGKFKGCRVDSLIKDEYPYLAFLRNRKIVVFDKEVTTKILEEIAAEDKKRHYEEEQKPYLEFDDLPF